MQGSKTAQLVFSGLCMSGLLSCSNSSAHRKSPVFSVNEWLDSCSPFTSYDGKQEIIFRSDGNIYEKQIDRGNVVSNSQSPSSWGKWETRTADRVALNLLGDGWSDYTLYHPEGDDHCILSQGTIEDVDLQNSWFGMPDFTPEPERTDP